jgi:hypothetical protein
MRTCSTHRRVTGSGHPLNRGLGGYCRGKYPGYQGPPVTAQNSGNNWFPRAGNGWGTIHPYQEMAPPLQLKTRATNLKRTNLRNDPRPSLLHPMISGKMRLCHLSAPPASLINPGSRPRPPVKHAREFPTMNKHCSLWASRSGGLRHLAKKGHSCRNPRASDSMYSSVESIPSLPNVAVGPGVHT